MVIILANLKTTHVDKRTIARIWPEVANVDQNAVAVPGRDERTERGVEAVQERRDEPRDSQAALPGLEAT